MSRSITGTQQYPMGDQRLKRFIKYKTPNEYASLKFKQVPNE